MTDPSPLLELRHLTKDFGQTCAVNHVSLRVGAGECLALVGHNGAGKTTLFKMILGLLKPTSGDILFGGHPIDSRATIGFLPELVSFHRALTGYELLKFFAGLRGVKRSTDFEALLKKVNLIGVGGNRISTYSKGMRQRLGLAQALIGRPRLLILDEPTSGLDPSSRRSFYALLDELRADGTTIILSSHALSEVEAYTSNVAIMRRGDLLADGPIQELAARAGLPVRMTVQLRTGMEQSSLYLRQEVGIAEGPGPGVLELEIADAQKMAVLHDLTGQPSVVADVHVLPPTLDDIYAHFQNGRPDDPAYAGGDGTTVRDNVTPFPGADRRRAGS